MLLAKKRKNRYTDDSQSAGTSPAGRQSDRFIGKGRINEKTKYVIGMALFRNPEGDDGHVAYYV